MPEDKPKVRIRMYRQGLGDCFLLTFYTAKEPTHMLVDFGTLGATTTGVKMVEVAADIAAETDKHLHLLIATHEHQDHVSGFRNGGELFDGFTIEHAWAAWTENPNDPKAVEVKKLPKDLAASLRLACDELHNDGNQINGEFGAIRSGVRGLLGFRGELPAGDGLFGADFKESVDASMRFVTSRIEDPDDFLSPGRVIEPVWLPGVRFYVLGPPRSEGDLKVLGDHDSPELYHVAAQMGRDLGRSLAFSMSGKTLADHRAELEPQAREEFDASFPFDSGFRIDLGEGKSRSPYLKAYDDSYEAWRRIDLEWIRTMEELALQLDDYTNNTSLVLAIELIDDGRVVLMPADAQLGNWRTWKNVTFTVNEKNGAKREVTAKDLLGRTIFYKVGHHASHNATMKEGGLEDMTRSDLVAMISVDSAVAHKRNPPWIMPADVLYKTLVEKTGGRVLRSDTGWPEDTFRPPSMTAEEWSATKANKDITIGPLYIDYHIH
jgi:hypothetical protein